MRYILGRCLARVDAISNRSNADIHGGEFRRELNQALGDLAQPIKFRFYQGVARLGG